MWIFSASEEEMKDFKGMIKRVLEAFVWMLIALWWTTVIQQILVSISENFPFLAVFWAFLYAILVTIFGIAILFYMNKLINFLLNKSEAKAEKIEQKDDIDKEFE